MAKEKIIWANRKKLLGKTVLVTGATGFIGRHVVRRLVSEGLEVHGLSRTEDTVDGVPVEPVDLANEKEFLNWRRGKKFDAIVHLASAIPDRSAGGEPKECFNKNVSMMLNVLLMSVQTNCRFIYSSGASVYGTIGGNEAPLTEERLPNPENYYATSKYVGDVLCRQMASSEGLSYAALRISAPYGPGCRRRTVVNIFLQSALEGKDLILHGSGKRQQDFTYIDDVVDAIWLSLNNTISGIFNVSGGSPVSMKKLAESVLEAVKDSKSRIIYSGEPDPQENYRAGFSIEKSRRQLGWSPRTGLILGLKLTADSLRGN